MGAGQRLVEMVVRVDEPRQHDMARGVERRVNVLGRLGSPDDLSDARAFDEEDTLGAVGKDGQGFFDPSAHACLPSYPPVPSGKPLGLMSTTRQAALQSHSSTG